MLKQRINNFFKKNFIEVDEELWADLQFKMLLENVFKVKTASIIGLAFMLILLILDYKRYLAGKIDFGNIYWYLFLTHIALILLVIPLTIIEVKKDKITSGQYPYSRQVIMLWMVIMAVISILMAAFSVLERGSMVMYALYIMMMNSVLTLFHSDRAYLNVVSFLVFMAAVYVVNREIDERFITILLESFGVTFITFSLSTHVYNMMLKEVHSERKLVEKNKQIEKARAESNKLLLNILPEKVAKELMEKGSVQPMNYKSTTVMMIDFVGFSKISNSLSSEELVQNLDYCFTGFDRIIKKHGVEKIKTIGDGYLCVGGIPTISHDHHEKTILAAFDILDFLKEYKKNQLEKNSPYFEGRIGIHTGSLTAGVVGETKFAYDVWGDTVNIAARLESSGEAGKINISKDTYELVSGKFQCEHRGELPIKNLGSIEMYFVKNL